MIQKIVIAVLSMLSIAHAQDWPKEMHNPFVQRSLVKPLEFLLKARIVSVDNNYVRDLGVMFQVASKGTEHGGTTNLGHFSAPIANLGNGQTLDLELQALEKQGHATMISSPEIVTLNNQKATIEAGEEVPYQQETANGGTHVSFKKAVLRLEVTPEAVSKGKISLTLHVNQDKVSALTVKGVPAIHTQQLTTKVILANQQTFALGGIYESNYANHTQGIPVLKSIPLLGYLFRTHHRSKDLREMMVFITVDALSVRS